MLWTKRHSVDFWRRVFGPILMVPCGSSATVFLNDLWKPDGNTNLCFRTNSSNCFGVAQGNPSAASYPSGRYLSSVIYFIYNIEPNIPSVYFIIRYYCFSNYYIINYNFTKSNLHNYTIRSQSQVSKVISLIFGGTSNASSMLLWRLKLDQRIPLNSETVDLGPEGTTLILKPSLMLGKTTQHAL